MPSAPSADSADVATDACVACIGVFDGVHRGHRALISHARERADARGLPLVAVTFDPHPTAVVRPGTEPTSLCTVERRIDLLLEAGADRVEVLEFDASTAATEAEDFIGTSLVELLHVAEVVVGENFRFGHRARGSVATLRSEGQRFGFDVDAVALAGEGGEEWSSTLVRELIADGEVAAAARVLGRDYRLDGVVVHGDHRGRELGFPTANLSWTDSPAVPGDGVYAGWVSVEGEELAAAISVGTNPQFAGTERRVEAYVLDREDLDLYGRRIGISFTERIREQMTFVDVPALLERIGADVDAARELLGIRG